MPRQIIFPPVEEADTDGLLAVGGDLELDTLLTAYSQGIFPWPISLDFPLAWFSPDPRGVLDVETFHIPTSFKKWLKKTRFKVTFSTCFETVILRCAQAERKNQPGTWITSDIIQGYKKLFEAGHAYSVEVWDDSNELVGGLYGVCFGGYLSGESMFSSKTGASKLALLKLVELIKENDLKWFDTQMVTPVVELFGGFYLPREEFITRLEAVDWNQKREDIFKYKTVLNVD